MNRDSILSRLSFSFSLLSLAVLVMGTRACQEDYELGTQSNVSPSETETFTETPTETETPTATETPTDSETETPTETPDESAASIAETLGAISGQAKASAIFKALGTLPESEAEQEESGRNINVGGLRANAGSPVNWLGTAFDQDDIVAGVSVDSDGDGFTDQLEAALKTDLNNQRSYPAPVTRLSERLRGVDDDGDGLSNSVESALGLNPLNRDSDGDGASDGAEKLSASDPLNPGERSIDIDKDGLSNQYEVAVGTNMDGRDTDHDGLQDDLEFALGSNPRDQDSDDDGIFDGREVELGSDPTLSEFGINGIRVAR